MELTDSLDPWARRATLLPTYRFLCLAFALLYPTFGLAHGLRSSAYDPLVGRLAIVGLVLAAYVASFVSDHVTNNLPQYLYGVGFVIGSHILYLLHRNGCGVDYVLGYILILVVVGHLFIDPPMLIAWVSYMLVGATLVAALAPSPAVDPSFIAGIAATFGGSSYVTLRVRIRVTERLRASNQRLSREIDDRMRAQKQAEEATVRAEAASVAKSRFLANMSHELRTPLNSVIGFAGILAKNPRGQLADTDLEYLQRIRDNGTHLLGLINDVLDLSKIEAGHTDFEPTSIDVPSLLGRLAERFEPQLADRDIRLRIEVPPGLAPLHSDPRRLEQILINLVSNAIKFTDRGQVTVRVESTPQRRPAAIAVVDTGIGIPPEQLPTIFDAFHQVDDDTNRRYQGTGLGLAICRSLCSALGFALTVTSVEGSGTTFRLDLDPAATPTAAAD